MIETPPPGRKIDLVVPVYNEASVINQFHSRLTGVLDALETTWRIIYVDDGSKDTTLRQLLEIAGNDSRISVIELSRNFGHQAALSAGLSIADGDYVITMDGDGQHPPGVIPEMISLADQGYDVVFTHRLEQQDIGPVKQITSKLFYWLINLIGSTQLEPGGADFRLLKSSAVLALRSLPEYHRFLRGMVAWIGFRTVVLPFQAEKRIAGSSKYSLRKMLRLASDAVFSFSLMPLYIAILIGLGFLVLSLFEMVYVLSFWFSGRSAELTPGWSSLMFVLLFVGGTILITLGIIGIYVGYIFQEVKRRPVYLIRKIYSFQNTPPGNAED